MFVFLRAVSPLSTLVSPFVLKLIFSLIFILLFLPVWSSSYFPFNHNHFVYFYRLRFSSPPLSSSSSSDFTLSNDYVVFMFVRCVCLLSNCPYDSTPALKSQYLLCLFFAKIAISCFPTSVNYSKKSPIIFATISTIGHEILTSITKTNKKARSASPNQIS